MDELVTLSPEEQGMWYEYNRYMAQLEEEAHEKWLEDHPEDRPKAPEEVVEVEPEEPETDYRPLYGFLISAAFLALLAMMGVDVTPVLEVLARGLGLMLLLYSPIIIIGLIIIGPLLLWFVWVWFFDQLFGDR